MLKLRVHLPLFRLRKILEHLAQGRKQLGQQLTYEFLALLRDSQDHPAPIVKARHAGNQAAAHQRIADPRHIGGALRGANAQIAGMGHAIGLREQRGEHAKFRFGKSERPDLLLEHHRHLTPDMHHQPAQ